MDETSLVEITAAMVSSLIEAGKIESNNIAEVYEEVFQVTLRSFKKEIEMKKDLGVLDSFPEDDLPDFGDPSDELFVLPNSDEEQTRFD